MGERSNEKIQSRIFRDLFSISPASVEIRAENAWGVAVKFLTLIQDTVKDEEAQRKLMTAWMKAVKDNDFRRFKRAYRRYLNPTDEKPPENP